MTPNDYKILQEKVYNYPTIHKEGFTKEEYLELLKDYPNVIMEKFWDALTGTTGMVTTDGKFITYHCDIAKAIECGLDNRKMKSYEWD